MTRKFTRRLLVGMGLASYAVGCVTPALHLVGTQNTQGEVSTMVGAAAFFCGLIGLLMGQYAWIANVLGLVALVLLWKRWYNGSLVCSRAAIVVAQHTRVLVGTEIMGDEGGVKKELVTSLGMGFYLWVVVFAFFALAALVRERGPGEERGEDDQLDQSSSVGPASRRDG